MYRRGSLDAAIPEFIYFEYAFDTNREDDGLTAKSCAGPVLFVFIHASAMVNNACCEMAAMTAKFGKAA
jgi:hypothetical protein